LFDAAAIQKHHISLREPTAGGDLTTMLQCKVALLVNIAHSRKFHEPTLE
jgi:hypothetical protein